MPDDPEDFDKELRIYKVIAAPVINGLGKLNTVFKLDDWDRDEAEAGKLAIAAMIYENGGKLSGEILFMMWVAGVYPHRIAKRLTEKKRETQQLHLPLATERKAA